MNIVAAYANKCQINLGHVRLLSGKIIDIIDKLNV